MNKEFATDLVNFQKEMKHAVKSSKNPHFNSKYADLPTVIDCNRDLLHAHNLAVCQLLHTPPTEDMQGVVIETVLIHTSGNSISSSFFMPSTKKDAQGFASAITYGRRYAFAAILGFASDEDDDGNEASSKGKPITAMQQSEIRALCVDYNIDLPEKLKEAGFSSLEDLSSNQANDWIKAIKKKYTAVKK